MKLKSLKISALSAAVAIALVGCGEEQKAETGGIAPKEMADALHAVMEADRTVYTKYIIKRLANEEKVIKASEHWKDEKALVLPAQMFRMGSEYVAEGGANFSYGLLSSWPINTQNAAKTDAEKAGLKFIEDNKGDVYYGEETLGGKKYFTALYPDIAVVDACVTCHNKHKDSPKTDFNIGDVMGGVIIRIPL